MSQSYDSYTHVANEFIQQVRQGSPAAADCLEQIRIQYGARSAYLAAFALVMLKERLNLTGYSSPQEALKTFTYYEEMHEDAEALQLDEDAIAHLLSSS